MRYVVLGSNGFVGKAIYNDFLKNNKFETIGLSKKQFDLLSNEMFCKMNDIFRDGDTVIFCAAEAPVKNLNMFSNNITMLNNLIQNLSNIKIKSFVYLSSDAVYSDSSSILNEHSQTNPENIHGLMHLSREKIVKLYFPTNHLILRPTLIYGYEDPHKGYGPNKFILTAIKNKEIEIFGNGEELRDHINIEDVVQYSKKLITTEKLGTYNIVSGQLRSFLSIATDIIEIAQYQNINIKLINLKRTQPMPHNGYRELSNEKILNLFPEIRFSNFKGSLINYFTKKLNDKQSL